MKNEKMARAMTYIDDDLVVEAAEVSRAGRVLRLQRTVVRWGSLAACLLIAVGILLNAALSDNVTMNGIALDAQPAKVSEAAYRAAPVSSDAAPDVVTVTLNFTLPTKLSAQNASIFLVEADGTPIPADGTSLRGAVTLQLASYEESFTVSTNRGYSLLFTSAEGEWSVSIEK